MHISLYRTTIIINVYLYAESYDRCTEFFFFIKKLRTEPLCSTREEALFREDMAVYTS